MAAALLSSFCLASAAGAAPWVSRWYPLELRGGHIHVPVEVGGVETTAVLVTGASAEAIDRAFAEANGIRVTRGASVIVQGIHSRGLVPLARRVPIELLGAPVVLKDVIVTDLPFANLVIGLGVLSSFAIQIGARLAARGQQPELRRARRRARGRALRGAAARARALRPARRDREGLCAGEAAERGDRRERTAATRILGARVLRQFVVTLDLRHTLLHLGLPQPTAVERAGEGSGAPAQ